MAMGLLAAALGGFGKGLANVGEMEAKKQNELNLKKQLMDIESEKRLREDEITRGRAFEYQKRDISELEPLRTTAAVSREKALIPVGVEKAESLIPVKVKETTEVGKAETGVQKTREDELRPGIIKTAEEKGKAENKLRLDLEKSLSDVEVDKAEKKARREALVLMDLGNDKKYLSALTKLADAKTSSTERAQLGISLNKMKQEQTINNLRTQLSKLSDTPENATARADIRRQIEDMTDKKLPSYADTASLANSYLVASNTILRNGTGTEEEIAEAKRLRDLGESIGRSIVEKKLPGAKTETKPGAPRKGEERSIAEGPNKGKTAVFDGTGWKLKQ